MIVDEIKEYVKKALLELKYPEVSFVVEHPADMNNGDFSTNVAMVLSKQLGKNPKEVAEEITKQLRITNDELRIKEIEVAGAGFINFYLAKEFFIDNVDRIASSGDELGKNKILDGKKIIVEYTQPNPFKPFHIGHLMSNTIGESLSRIIESSGASIIRANYQGDVGPHVAKAIWGLLQKGMPDENLSVSNQAQYIGECYSFASSKYEDDIEIKKEIDSINKKIYERSDEKINGIYDYGRRVTLEAFEEIYKLLGTKFDYYYFESEVAPIGLQIVNEYLSKGVFEKSDGAVIFNAEKFNPKLHTRVFVNSHGLPTYETKEIGLTFEKFTKLSPDLSIVTTAVEQAEYMKVVECAISQINPQYAEKMKHITHGMMRFASGKMSSRTGNVVTGESLLSDCKEIIMEKIADKDFDTELRNEIINKVAVSALKYSILRSSIGGDIIYDFEKSISFEGDSGPYLQYSALRAKSVLFKSNTQIKIEKEKLEDWKVTNLEKLLARYDSVVVHAIQTYSPHFITTYLTDLAGEFNSFYGGEQILDRHDGTTPYRLAITEAFFKTMKVGLHLLGIELPSRM